MGQDEGVLPLAGPSGCPTAGREAAGHQKGEPSGRVEYMYIGADVVPAAGEGEAKDIVQCF